MEVSLNTDLQTRISDHNRFSLALYSQLNKTSNNQLISPYAVDLLIAMLYAGARSSTAREIEQALNYNQDAQSTHLSFAEINGNLRTIQDSEKISIQIANALWPQQNTPFLSSYTHLIREMYGGTILPLDYIRPEKARETINNWVDEKTGHKINQLIQIGGLNSGARMVLTSAACFSGNWAKSFDVSLTHTALFKVNQREHIDVPMMHQTGTYRYAEIDHMQILEIPYSGNELSMFIFLPVEGIGFADIERQLNLEKLNYWLSQPTEEAIEFCLPRFEISSNILLCPLLNALGMKEAFTESADFSGMNGFKWLYISACLHKTLLHLDETGNHVNPAPDANTRAASSDLTTFRVDHPCIFLIRENLFGTILFIGRLVKP